MKNFGIYTLANDAVYDQLVALLNSIEVNVSKNIPICVIPYDDRLGLVKQEIAFRSNVTLFYDENSINFTLSPEGQDRTGNCANADPFVNIDNVLYNEQDLKPIHRLHYMGYSAMQFTRLSRGEDVKIAYRDEFLHYRFLKQPEKKPKQLKLPSIALKTNRFIQKAVNKVKKSIA